MIDGRKKNITFISQNLFIVTNFVGKFIIIIQPLIEFIVAKTYFERIR